MTISHLYDHTVALWRKVETLGEAGVTEKTFALADRFGVKMNRKNVQLMQDGAGIVDVGMRKVYTELGPTVLRRDLVELLTGPDAPALLEVENVTRPRGHHIEIHCSEYKGDEPVLIS
jgi:hypothetical protein